VGRKEDIQAIKDLNLPEPYGVSPNESVKARRKVANNKYRSSQIGKAHARKRYAIKSVKDSFVKRFLETHPDYEEECRKKFFTKRFDGLGSDYKASSVQVVHSPSVAVEYVPTTTEIFSYLKRQYKRRGYQSTVQAHTKDARIYLENLKKEEPDKYDMLLSKLREELKNESVD
jgi:uncharacterized short protein YbdD (DUF466 family)